MCSAASSHWIFFGLFNPSAYSIALKESTTCAPLVTTLQQKHACFFLIYVVFIRQMCQCNIFCAAFLISNMLFACCALVTVRHDASTCILSTTSSTQGLIGLTDRHRRILTDRYFLGFPGRTRHMENQRHWWSVPLLDPTWSIMILLLILCLPACKRKKQVGNFCFQDVNKIASRKWVLF